ncbi:MAG: ABC transporter substrate-binding protein [Candidatus Dormibacteraeota bacterium]|nr:ABC transporter substrate-binding protein [Candidatus Dormibacteraeota bacterium]
MASSSTSDDGFERFERLLEEWSRRDFLRRLGGTVAWAGFMAGGVGFLEACGNSTSTGQQSATPKKGGHVVEGSFSDIKGLNPVLISDTYSNTLTSLLFDTLLGVKANGDLTPLLAKSMPQISSDQTEITFTLQDGVKWSDGQALTADDVKFSFDLMFDPQYKVVNSPRRGDLETHLQSITVKDAHTVVFKTQKPWAPFLSNHAAQRQILPKHVLGPLAPAAINSADFNSAPSVASGAFKFVRWDKGQQVVLARNDNYFRGAGLLDQYVYKVLPDSVTLVNQLKTGEVDIGPVDPSLWDSLATVDNLHRIDPFGVAIFAFYAYNLDPAKHGGKLFGDKAVRQALLHALDRQQMADSVYFKQATPADSIIPPISWAHATPKTNSTFDKTKAEQMLDAAGWAKGADGIRTKGGLKLQFEMITNAGNKQRESLLQVMQQSWKDVGVDATPRLVQFPQLVSQITNERSFDVFLVGFSFDPDPDENQLWSSNGAAPGGFNGFQYKNPAADRLWDEAASTFDRSKRKQLYSQLQDIYAEDVPAPILVFNKGLWAYSKRVQSWSVGAFNQYGNRWFMKDTWVSDGK